MRNTKNAYLRKGVGKHTKDKMFPWFEVLDFGDKFLAIVIALCTIVSLFFNNVFFPIWNNRESVRIDRAEKKIESIKISSNKNYIEDILGLPVLDSEYKYYENDTYDVKTKTHISGDIKTGHKSVYIEEFFILVAYYNCNNTFHKHV